MPTFAEKLSSKRPDDAGVAMNSYPLISTYDRVFYKAMAKWLSFLLATPLSLVFLIHPALMLDSQGNYSHGSLSLVMLGISAGFIHGVSFVPRFWLWKILFSPIVGWPLLLFGYYLLWQAQVS